MVLVGAITLLGLPTKGDKLKSPDAQSHNKKPQNFDQSRVKCNCLSSSLPLSPSNHFWIEATTFTCTFTLQTQSTHTLLSQWSPTWVTWCKCNWYSVPSFKSIKSRSIVTTSFTFPFLSPSALKMWIGIILQQVTLYWHLIQGTSISSQRHHGLPCLW